MLYIHIIEIHSAYATKIRKAVISKSKSLSKKPERGQEEELLKPLGHGHLYIVVENHYKVIYIIIINQIMITDVFDTRQSPEKMVKRSQ